MGKQIGNLFSPSMHPRDDVTKIFKSISFAALCSAKRSLKKAEESLSWPSAAGKVERVDVLTASGGTRGRTHWYEPLVEYSYEVNGASHFGRAISAFNRPGMQVEYSRREAAERVVARYRSGASVIVYYSPQNPSEAMLEPSSKRGAATAFLITGSFLAIAVGMLLAGARFYKGPINSSDNLPVLLIMLPFFFFALMIVGFIFWIGRKRQPAKH